jgi:hypothetical protein
MAVPDADLAVREPPKFINERSRLSRWEATTLQHRSCVPSPTEIDVLELMRTRISLFLILTFLTPVAAAQDNVRDRAAGPSTLTQRKGEEAQRKAQAIDILKGIVESAADIPETQTRVAVLTGALDLLWKHDESYARANFIRSAAMLSDKFASDVTQRQERSQIRASIGVLLRAFGRHDSQAAARLLDKFDEVLEEVLKGNSLSSAERLSIAEASLDSDAVQSVALAAKVLESGVPGSFPSYLNELEQRDAAAAGSLFRVALSILAEGRVYSPIHVTVLSTYVFRESQMSVPVARLGRDGVPLEFGTFASPLSPPSRDLNPSLVAAYLAASGTYLNTEAIGLEQRVDPDPIHVGLSFFLVKKLAGYARRLGVDGGQNWIVLDTKYSLLAERANLSERALNGLASVAQRIVAENTVFRFDGGDAAFASAEKTSDSLERAELLATGIRQLIDEGKYADAVQKISDLRDNKLAEQLNTYLSFRMAEASLKKRDWFGFNAHVNRLSDAGLRTYLVLSAALAASEAKKKKMSSEFLLTAMASLPKIEDADARAAAFVTTAGILFATTDVSWTPQVLTEAMNAINRAKHYDGGVYGVTIEAANSKVWAQLPKFDLNECLVQAAKRDWTGALAAAQSIESKALRSQAYIAACSYVL